MLAYKLIKNERTIWSDKKLLNQNLIVDVMKGPTMDKEEGTINCDKLGDESIKLAESNDADFFDDEIEASIDNLEPDTFVSISSDGGDSSDDEDEEKEETHQGNKIQKDKLEQILKRKRRASDSTLPDQSSSSSEEETESEIDKKLALFNKSISIIRSPDVRNPQNHHVSFPLPPPLPRFGFTIERRRLSQCKEENEEEDPEKNTQKAAASSSSSTNVITSLTKDVNLRNGNGNLKEILKEAVLPVVSRFTVTKAEAVSPRIEAENLRNLTAKQNSHTIHFPCSSAASNRPTAVSLFAPHLDKQFFDSSLVEIRPVTSSQTIDDDTSFTDSIDAPHEVWVKRPEKLPVSHIPSAIN